MASVNKPAIKADAELRRIEGDGVPEQAWRECAWLRELPTEDPERLFAGVERLVVVSPHPDDEVLACGGLMASAHALGREVLVVSVTDGEACYPDQPEWPPERLRDARQLELDRALERLGLAEAPRIAWHVSDGAVAAHEAELQQWLRAVLREGDLLLAPWHLDGHPDHEAVGRACAQAAAACGCGLREYPVWGWHWLDPAVAPRVWQGASRFALAPSLLLRKRQAIEEFVTQTGAVRELTSPPILPEYVLRRFQRDYEVLLS